MCNESSAISAKDKAAEVEISKRPPPSHLRDALVKEDDENLDDNVEKPPKRKKGSKPREIIKPDPKYKGRIYSVPEKKNTYLHLDTCLSILSYYKILST